MDEAVTPDEKAPHRRAEWPVVVRKLSDPEEPKVFGTAGSRLRAVEELTNQCWALSGLPMPDYPRHETPVKLVRPGERNGSTP